MKKNNFRTIVLIWWPLLAAIALFCAFIPLADNIDIDNGIRGTIVAIMFTMFGFSITSLTIIMGFIKESKKVLSAIKKGYFITITSLISWMLIISIFILFAAIFKLPSFLFISVSSSGMFVISYFVYIIIQLLRFSIKNYNNQ